MKFGVFGRCYSYMSRFRKLKRHCVFTSFGERCLFFFLAVGLVFIGGNLTICLSINLLRGSSLENLLATVFAMWVTM